MIGALATGCGNLVEVPTVIGSTGVSVNADGTAVIVVAICRWSVNSVIIAEGRAGLKEEEVNPEVGEWKASSDLDGVVELDLAVPNSSWRRHAPVALESGTQYLVETDGDEGSAGGVDFFGRDLDDLTPDQVLVDGKSQPRSTFERSCD